MEFILNNHFPTKNADKIEFRNSPKWREKTMRNDNEKKVKNDTERNRSTKRSPVHMYLFNTYYESASNLNFVRHIAHMVCLLSLVVTIL